MKLDKGLLLFKERARLFRLGFFEKQIHCLGLAMLPILFLVVSPQTQSHGIDSKSKCSTHLCTMENPAAEKHIFSSSCSISCGTHMEELNVRNDFIFIQ